VIVLSMVVFGGASVADWLGWDRHSVAGTTRFSLGVFGLYIATQMMFVAGMMATLISPAIASERDRKTLDALLATRASSAEIVLGALGSGLLRYANSVLPVIPLLLIFLPVDPRLILIAFLGLTSTAILMGAISVAVSARIRTAVQATRTTMALFVAWLWVPLLLLMVLPRVWPVVARWMAPFALPLLDSSPLGIGLTLGGVLPRGTMVVCTLRMIAYQSAASILLILWTIVRLRAASRSLYDEEGRSAFRRMLRSQSRSRPPCGDDPVFWLEIHSRRSSRRLLLIGHVLNAIWIGLFAYVLSWFAIPAFVELFEDGYRAGQDTAPEFHPLARMVAFRITGSGVASEQARLEFNIILRQATAVIGFIYVILIAGTAAESIVVERERDTWSGLIATPLTGREILGAKMLGMIWNARSLWILLLALWIVGLLAGSVHPSGFVAAVAGLGVSTWWLLSIGIYASLWGRDRSQAVGRALFPLLATMGLGFFPFAWPGMASVLLGGLTMPFQMWESLLSYEDVHAALKGEVSSQLASVGVQDVAGLWIGVAVWLVNIVAQGVGACLLSRAAYGGFDRAVGRPAR
jgi:ABC-type transport system involved in multi-copper enzyme maturation permease subunit